MDTLHIKNIALVIERDTSSNSISSPNPQLCLFLAHSDSLSSSSTAPFSSRHAIPHALTETTIRTIRRARIQVGYLAIPPTCHCGP